MSKNLYYPTCPKCKGHEFELRVLRNVKVAFNDTDEQHEVVDSDYGGIEWGDGTRATCTTCLHTSPLRSMYTDRQIELRRAQRAFFENPTPPLSTIIRRLARQVEKELK
jgi:hypothetical protein